MKAEFDKAMNALLLHVDKSIVDSIRKIGHEYADEVRQEGYKKGFGDGSQWVRDHQSKQEQP